MKRYTIYLPPADVDFLEAVADRTSDSYRALSMLVETDTFKGESAVLRSLVQIGRKAVEDERLTEQYNRAVAAGEFDDEETKAFMRHVRRTGARMARENP